MAEKLNAEDLAVIAEFNRQYKAVLETINRATQFKLGDFLVLYISDYQGNMQLQKNSYGAPVKYKVVHVTEEGIGFVKKVNKKGTPIGEISSLAGTQNDEYRDMTQTFRFELDPDYADSIILQENYDPAHLHRSKKDIWKAVTDHNKNCKIKTANLQDVVDYFKLVNIGDTLWTSNSGFYLVQDKKTMTPKDFNNKAKWNDQTRIKGPFVIVLTVRDKKGKVRDVSPDFFWGKALYKERPRTYKELNI